MTDAKPKTLFQKLLDEMDPLDYEREGRILFEEEVRALRPLLDKWRKRAWVGRRKGIEDMRKAVLDLLQERCLCHDFAPCVLCQAAKEVQEVRP